MFSRRRILTFSLGTTIALTLIGCGKTGSEDKASGGNEAPAASVIVANPRATFTASPNPVTVSDGSKLGIVKLTWDTSATKSAEIRVGKPDGTLLCNGPSTYACDTGKWVTDGMTFYLQDSTAAKPTDAAATLNAVTVRLQ